MQKKVLFLFSVSLLTLQLNLKAQFTLTETFKGSTTQGTIIMGDAAKLTSGSPDPVNQGWLRLTPASNAQRGYAYINKSFPSSLGALIEFEYKSWRPSNDAGYNGADGFTVFLFDASVSTFTLGAYGGSLGYANNDTDPGLSGGFLGMAIDEFGNFATANEGRNGGVDFIAGAPIGPNVDFPYLRPNSISIRGATTSNPSTTNPYLGGVTLKAGSVQNIGTTIGDGAENEIDYNTYTSTRPTDAQFFRRVQIDIKPSGVNRYSITVRWKKTANGNFIDLLTFLTPVGSIPPSFMKIGFAASTGNGFNYHEIRNIMVTTPGNIRITKRADKDVLRSVPDTYSANQVSYQIDVANDNPVALSNILFTDSLTDANGNIIPLSGFTITNVTNSGFSAGTTITQSPTSNKVTGSLNMAGSSSGRITITGTLAAVPIGNVLNNTANIIPTDISDPDIDNNTAVVSTPVLAENVDIIVQKSTNTPCLSASGNTFTTTVHNMGTVATTAAGNKIVLIDSFPATYTFAANSNPGWTVVGPVTSGANKIVTYSNISTLASGAATSAITYTLTAPGGVTGYTDKVTAYYMNSSNVDIELVPNRGNNSASNLMQVVSANPTVTTPITYCLNGTAVPLTATATGGNTLLWYRSQGGVSSVNAPTPLTTPAGTTAYYVTQTNGTCESGYSQINVAVQAAVVAGAIGSAQTICNGATAATLTSTTAGSGGSGTSSYRWENSIDGGTTWTTISGQTGTTCAPGSLTQTTRIRRVFISTLNGVGCEAATAPVIITVQNIPTAGTVDASQSICTGSQPAALTSSTNGTGSGTLTYRWESSPNGLVWTIISGQTGTVYAPGTLTATTLYRRTTISTLSSNVCTSSPGTPVTITVLQPPTASSAGPDITQNNSGIFTMQGNTPSIGSGSWAVVSGTGTIIDPSIFNTTVTIPANSSAILRWTIANIPCASSTDDVAITYTRSSNLQVTQTVDNTNPIVDENVVFTVTVKNNGPTDATGVVVTDLLPAGYTFVSASSGSYNSTTGEWTVGNLSNSISQTLNLTAQVNANQSDYTNTTTVIGTEADIVPSNNTATVNNIIPVRSADIQLSKTASPKPAVAGQPLTYTITIQNNGPSNLLTTDVFSIAENLPPAFAVSSYNASVGTFNSTTHNWSGLTLTPGQTASLTITGSVAATATGSITNTATISVPVAMNDPNLTNNSQTDNTAISRVLDLGISKTASPKPVQAGTALTYILTLTNNGPSTLLPADIINITDNFPAGFTSSSFTPSAGTFNSTNGNWTGLSVATGQTATLTIAGNVAATVTGSLSNTASVSEPVGTTDNNPSNNTATDNTIVNRVADLSIVKTALPDPAIAGEAMTYSIQLVNNGPAALLPADVVNIADLLPTGFTPSGYGTTFGTFDSNTGNLTGLSLLAGEIVTITITGVVAPSLTGSLTNSATVTAPTDITDPVSLNNATSVNTVVIAKPVLNITKTGASSLTAGASVTYTLQVANAGSSDAINAAIIDAVPASISGVTWTATAAGAASIISGVTGSGNSIAVNVNIPAGSTNTITVNISGTLDAGATGNITNAASVASSEPQGSGTNSSITSSVTSTSGVVISKSSPSAVVAGELVNYRIEIGNNGPSNATGIQIADLVPASISTVSWSTLVQGSAAITSGASGTGNAVNVTANIPAGTSNKVIIDVSGTVLPGFIGSITNTAVATPQETGTTPVSANAVTQISSHPVFTISKSGPATAIAGNNINYIISVRNTGPSNSTNTSITDVIPATLSDVSWTSLVTDGTATITAGATGTGNIINVTGNFNANSTIQINVNGNINPNVLTPVSNTATVTPSEAGVTPVLSNTVTTNVNSRSGLTISKNGPSTIISGSTITYTIEAGNNGPSDAVGAAIADAIPASIIDPSWTSTVQGAATILSGGNGAGYNLQTVVNIPSGAGNKVIITIIGKVDPTLNAGITNTATATPQESSSPAPQSSVTTTANRTPVVAITKSGPTALLAGANITYLVEVINIGQSDALNMAVSDMVPPEIGGVSWSAIASGTASISNGSTGAGNNLVLEVNIPAGSDNKILLTITGKMSGAFNGTLQNQAVATPAEAGTVPVTSAVTTTVSKIPVLAIQKTGPASINSGQVVTYTIRVNNTSTANANAAVITDNVPANIQQVTWTAMANGGAAITAGAAGSGNNISVTADLPGETSSEVVITVNGVLDASATGNLVNSATVTPAEPGAATKISADVVTQVIKSPSVSLLKTGPATANAGQTVTYVIEAVNNGPSNADNIVISDIIPVLLTNVSWTAVANGNSLITTTSGTGDVNVSGNLLVDNANSIQITVTGTIPSAQLNTTMTNTAIAIPVETGVAVSSNSVQTTIINRSGIAISKSAPAVINAGETVNYTLTITNNGPSNAVAALIEDNVPADISNVSWTAISTGSALVTQGTGGTGNSIAVTANIPVGNTNTVVVNITGQLNADFTNTTLTNAATVTPSESGNPVVNSNNAVTNVNIQSDLRMSKTGPGSLSAGEIVTYVLTVGNQGPSDVTGAVITDNLPAEIRNATWTVATVGTATANTGSGTGNVNLTASLKAGGADKVIITIVGQVDPFTTATTLVNTAEATPPAGITDPSPASDAITSNIARTANVRIVKSGPSDGRAGDQVIYTLRVTNEGPSNAPATTIIDNMPAGIVSQTWVTSASGGANISQTSGTGDVLLTADIPSLTGVVEVTVTGILNPGLTTGAAITNISSVSVASGITDPELTNNTSQVVTNIDNEATFLVSKSGPANANVGDNVTYTISVKNTGLGDITNATIVDNVPADVQVTSWQAIANGSASIQAGAPTSGNTNAISTVADIPAGSGNSVLLTIQGIILPTAGSSFTNTAEVTSGNVKHSSVVTSVNRSTDISVVKAGPQTLAAGEDIIYTVNVFNNGYVSVQGLQIVDNVYSFISNVTWDATVTGTATITGVTSGTGNSILITGDIPAGQSNYITLTIHGTLPSGLPNTNILNSAEVIMPAGVTDYNPANNISEITTGVALRPNVTVLKSGPGSANAGNSIAYTINISNSGPSDAYGVVISDIINAAITGVMWTATTANGAIISSGATGNGNNLSALADIPAGGNITFFISGVISPDFSGNIDNTAAAAIGAAPPVLSPVITTVVSKQVNLSIIKSGMPSLSAGLPITYTIEATNAGPSNTTGSVITDNIPASIQQAAWSTTILNGATVTANPTGTGNNLSVTANIPANGRVLITVTGTVASSTTMDLTNIAVLTPAEPGHQPVSSQPVITVIRKTPQLQLIKSAAPTAASGEQITYTLHLSNDGPSDAVDTRLSDAVPTEISNVQWTATAVAGASISNGQTGNGNNVLLLCNVPVGGFVDVVIIGTIDPLFRGTLVNTATAIPSESGIPEQQQTVSTVITPAVGLVISKSGPAQINAGNMITYQVVVTNNGPSTALNASITDMVAAQISNPQWTAVAEGNAVILSGSDGIGSNVAVTANIPANAADRIIINITGVIAPSYQGDITNTATVLPAETNIAVPSTPVVTTVNRVPVITITKSAPEALRSGNTITYLIEVANTGNGDAQNLSVSDIMPAVFTDVKWNAEALGSATISASSGTGNVAITAGIPAGSGNSVNIRITGLIPTSFDGNIVNTVTATPAESTAVVASSSVTTAVFRASVALVKTATNTVVKAGDVIRYDLVITNTGSSILTDVTVIDPGADAGSIVPGITASIVPGESATVNAAHTVTQQEADLGSVINSAIVDARAQDEAGVSDISGQTVSDDIPTVTIITARSSVTLVKTAAPVNPTAGEVINYTLILRNTGNVTLYNLVVTDPKAVVSGSPVAILFPGQVTTLSASHVLTQADVDAASFSNSAAVTATPASGSNITDLSGTGEENDDPTVVTLQPAGTITLTKTADNAVTKAGDVINYTIVVKNSGNVTLTAINIADAGADAGSIVPATIPTLEPGNSATITATHTVTQTNADRGIYRNMASATATDPKGNSIVLPQSDDPNTPAINDSATSIITPAATVNVVKTGVLASDGNHISYSFIITNTGNVNLNSILLLDAKIGLNRTPGSNLAPGVAHTETYEYPITQADRDMGSVTNSATVSANTPTGITVTDVSGTSAMNDDPTVTTLSTTASLTLVKTGVFSGNIITYTFAVTNTGSVTLSNITYSDVKLGITGKALDAPGGLPPGGMLTATEVYTVTAADRTVGTVTNSASVNARTIAGVSVTDISGTAAGNNTPTVTPVPNNPVAHDDAVTTNANTPVTINVLLNDDPVNSTFDLQSIAIVTRPVQGLVTIHNNGTVTYTPAVGYTGGDSFTYRVKDASGFYTNTATVTITISFNNIKIPTLFTPNGDGRNDQFVIVGLNQYIENELIIVNRWGNEVFRQKNYQNTWKATGLHEGTYYYVLRGKRDNSNQWEIIKGYVTLIKTLNP
ncbi:gliding motility-associated C-terminal domain-containing protein [Chitinophaga sp. SYP-B3965]|uniref:DUF7507 domain-containing protein n=1 Tax=Chitinophaga sp. SYP-B3965 TaxID=2663120 RepID=UPI001566EBD9|nr:gliding motility-associated C-terminal domain-containing protein [Chitinophaga sp. SYP-B3965]